MSIKIMMRESGRERNGEREGGGGGDCVFDRKGEEENMSMIEFDTMNV